MFHLKYLHVFYRNISKHVNGKKYGNYHLQYLFDDLHVIYMFFTYYVNFQLFQCKNAFTKNVDTQGLFGTQDLKIVGRRQTFGRYSLSERKKN